ncbi:conserved hypothetical protein [Ricinus communis]|uniref:Uncharacterized protein n=1 Tax=Ricinus communis TaxID=3988 RepID=B9TJG3_RICCO|nr:conserved hypothetical protein [Ricinus communis]
MSAREAYLSRFKAGADRPDAQVASGSAVVVRHRESVGADSRDDSVLPSGLPSVMPDACSSPVSWSCPLRSGTRVACRVTRVRVLHAASGVPVGACDASPAREEQRLLRIS